MCGRYVIYDQLTQSSVDLLGHEISANFNVAPTANTPIIRLDPDTGDQELVIARWGLVPHWAKDLKIPPFFNARADKLKGNKVFWPSITHRCLVPMAGFYEWSEHDKQPYFIHIEPEQLFYTAGIWNRWQPKNGAAIDSFAIITTRPNKVLADIHHRMPVILDDQASIAWLIEPYEEAKRILSPCLQKMAKYPVDPKIVNYAKNNTIECITRI